MAVTCVARHCSMRATNCSCISSLRHSRIVSAQVDSVQLLLIIKTLEFIRLKYQLTVLSQLIPLYHIVGKCFYFNLWLWIHLIRIANIECLLEKTDWCDFSLNNAIYRVLIELFLYVIIKDASKFSETC